MQYLIFIFLTQTMIFRCLRNPWEGDKQDGTSYQEKKEGILIAEKEIKYFSKNMYFGQLLSGANTFIP